MSAAGEHVAPADAAISVRDLWTRFGDHWVHRGIDLSVARGESLAIIGGSGAGKSSLFRVLVGLEPPTRGEILVDGVDVARASRTEIYTLMQRVGVLFQFGALFDSLPVWENVTFALQDRGLDEADRRRITAEKLKMVGLQRIEDQLPSQLSGGMRKRVALARAIATEPSLLFCDEPTSGLDPVMSDVISELVVQMKERLGVTIVTITHDMKSANKIADRIAMLYEGEILALDTPESLCANPDPIVQQFVQGTAVGPMSTSG